MKEYKVVVVGNGGVGKSALTMQYVQGIFVSSYDATIEDSYRKQTEVDGQLCRLEILDTAGTEQFTGMRDLYMRNGQGFVLVFSLSDSNSFNEMRTIRDLIVKIKRSNEVPIVLVGNKSDLQFEREVQYPSGNSLAKEFGCPYFETSAKCNMNVTEIFHECTRRIMRFDHSRPNNRRTSLDVNDNVKKKNSDHNCCSLS